MKFILFLLVLYKGDVRYMIEEHETLDRCRTTLQLGISEFLGNPEIKTIRAECIQTGVSV